jgi:hypothetical protein
MTEADDRFCTSAYVRKRYGDVSDMWLWRRLHDDSGFPRPMIDGLLADLGPAWPWHRGYVCGVSVAYCADGGIRAHYFPLRHPDTNNFDRAQVFAWLIEAERQAGARAA